MLLAYLRGSKFELVQKQHYLMSRYSGNWRTPLHKTAKKLRDKHNLKWLRVRMINKRHQNLKEMLLGDIAISNKSYKRYSRSWVCQENQEETMQLSIFKQGPW